MSRTGLQLPAEIRKFHDCPPANGVTVAARSDSLLRMAMRVDAGCSALCGAAFVVAAGALSAYTRIPRSVQYSLGVGFVLYGIAVFVLAGLSQVRTAGIGVAVANALGTVLAVVVVVADLLPLTTIGVVVVLGIGLYTLVFANLQYLGVRRVGGGAPVDAARYGIP